MTYHDNQRLKICFFHKFSPPFDYHTISGGAERVVLQLAQYMSRCGHYISIVNTLPKDHYDEEAKIRFISSQKAFMARIASYTKVPTLLKHGHIIGGLFRLFRSELDVLHATTSDVFAWKDFFKIKSRVNVLHFHDDPNALLYDRKILNLKIRPILSRILRSVDVYIAPSHYIARKILYSGLVEKDKVHIIPNGVCVKKLTSLPEQREGNKVLFVGAIVPQKGLHVLIEAMKIVKEAISGSELLIVGSPLLWGLSRSDPYVEYVLRKVRGLNYVRFLGLVEEEQKIKLYRSASVCVVPSIYGDPFNLVVLEAQAAGLPVIASKVGGIPELIDDGITGVLVKPGDAFELGRKIIQLLSNEKLRKTISRNAQLQAKKYDWSCIGDRFLKIYLSYIK